MTGTKTTFHYQTQPFSCKHDVLESAALSDVDLPDGRAGAHDCGVGVPSTSEVQHSIKPRTVRMMRKLEERLC